MALTTKLQTAIQMADVARDVVKTGTALLLEGLTRWDAQIWMTLQAKWDLWHALRARGRRQRVKALPRLTAQAAS